MDYPRDTYELKRLSNNGKKEVVINLTYDGDYMLIDRDFKTMEIDLRNIDPKKQEVLWFVDAMDDILGKSKELQFIEYSKEDALDDVRYNRCDFAERSFKFCKIYARGTTTYLGEIEDSLKYSIYGLYNPYKPLYFKMNVKEYNWELLSDLEYKQEYYNYLKEDKNLQFPVEQLMKYHFGENWEEGLKI